MDKFGKSQPVKRVEDVRFLTGHGRYVDDVAPDGALRAFVFRSPVAHAEITTLDVEAAREAEGVHLVVTSEDLLAAGIDTGMSGALAPNRDGSKGAAPKRPVLAEGRHEAGRYTPTFDGGRLPSGTYLVRIQAGTFGATRSMTLSR